MSSQKLNYRQTRWTLYLFRFDFTLKHMSGSRIGRVNSLSRCSDQQIEIERDNENRMLVKKEQLEIRVTQVVEIVIEEVDLLKKIKKSNAKDNKVIKVVKEIK